LSERVAAFYISTITNKTTADKLAISIIRINVYCCGYKKEPPPHKNGAGHMVVQGNKWGIWLNLMTLGASVLLFLGL
jgi:hypothetical protein